ncbi:hypothetical protein [Natrinema sp. SYSU A 869]|uniref:hypothetical protein n=1 Tax=Natrinema sp. SYSU A 869 TaxID=2871694 RepID=UPI001CA3DE20|nr:hypothetical protein [Natrinema sp. SYSU A 869]
MSVAPTPGRAPQRRYATREMARCPLTARLWVLGGRLALGDVRKALTLFRQASETANDRGLETVSEDCIAVNLEATEREATIGKPLALPANHFLVLTGVTGCDQGAAIKQPVTTEGHELLQGDAFPAELCLGEHAIREVVTDLETMGLVETWIDAWERDGRVKQITTTFEPVWVHEATDPYTTESEYLVAMNRH